MRQVEWSVQPGPAVAQVSCGFGHTLLLDRQGGVWACGYAGDGALGVGRDQPNAVAPRYVDTLEGVRVTAVSAGGLHSLALVRWGLPLSCHHTQPGGISARASRALGKGVADTSCAESSASGIWVLVENTPSWV